MKKVLALLLSAAMVLSMAGCGGGKDARTIYDEASKKTSELKDMDLTTNVAMTMSQGDQTIDVTTAMDIQMTGANTEDMRYLATGKTSMAGQDIDMWAYYNNADEVELFVNGKSQGIRTKGKDDFHVMWRVKYEPGVVRAVSRRNGKTVLEREIRTAGEPAQIRLTADRSEIKSDGKDLIFISVEILDKDGNLCPNADNQVMFDD